MLALCVHLARGRGDDPGSATKKVPAAKAAARSSALATSKNSEEHTAPEKSSSDAASSGGDVRKSLQLMRDKTGIQRSASAKRCRAARKEVGPLVRTARSLRLPARHESLERASPRMGLEMSPKPPATKAVKSYVQTAPPKSPMVSPVLGARRVLQETHLNVGNQLLSKPLSAPPSPDQWLRRSPVPQTRAVLRSVSPVATPQQAQGNCNGQVKQEEVVQEAGHYATGGSMAVRSPPVPWQCQPGMRSPHCPPPAAGSPCVPAARVEGVRSCHDGIPEKAAYMSTFGGRPGGTCSPAPSFLLPAGMRPVQLKLAPVCATPPSPMTPLVPCRDGQGRDGVAEWRAVAVRAPIAIPWFPKTDPPPPKIPLLQHQTAAVARATFGASPTRRRQINV